jgi:hypothetical protein
LKYGAQHPAKLVSHGFGVRAKSGFPNISDSKNPTSVAIATRMFEELGVPQRVVTGDEPGGFLEGVVEAFLKRTLPRLDSSRPWLVGRKRLVAAYEQYEHLGRLDELIKKNPVLRAEIGRDYVIKPDVCVGLEGTGAALFLHAAVSCKWTLRSDRAQNVRHEAVMLVRHRRGRLPHIVTVTSEPLASRIAALARGTGDVDAVYHVALDALQVATDACGTPEQSAILTELVTQRRLFDLAELPRVLVR